VINFFWEVRSACLWDRVVSRITIWGSGGTGGAGRESCGTFGSGGLKSAQALTCYLVWRQGLSSESRALVEAHIPLLWVGGSGGEGKGSLGK
jgi:hypothetical protein